MSRVDQLNKNKKKKKKTMNEAFDFNQLNLFYMVGYVILEIWNDLSVLYFTHCMLPST